MSIYNESVFLEYKEKMKNDWMIYKIDAFSLGKDFNSFFFHIHEDFSRNCLIIGLLRFLCKFGKMPLRSIVPYHEKKTVGDTNAYFVPLNTLLGSINEKTSKRFTTFFKNQNPIINYYFWNVAFPNFFGNFICDEQCTLAVNFLNLFKDNINLYSDGVISFISHNYLFQNTFLNAFYTKINQVSETDGSRHYNWCKYDFNQFDKILQDSLILATKHLNSKQIEIIKKFHESCPQRAEELFFTEIILFNIQNIWRFSPLFLPNNMLYNNSTHKCQFLANLEAKYVENSNSKENLKNFFSNFFATVETMQKPNEIKTCHFFVLTSVPVLLTDLDYILLDLIFDPDSSTFESKLFKTKENDELFEYIMRKAFVFKYYQSIVKGEIDLECKPHQLVNQLLANKWDKHVERCKLQNVNPLSYIFNGDPADKDLAYFGLYNEYHRRIGIEEYKNKVSRLIGAVLTPIRMHLDSHDVFIQINALSLASSIIAPGCSDFSVAIKSVYINHFAELAGTAFEMIFFNENYKSFHPCYNLFKRVFNRKEVEEAAAAQFEEFFMSDNCIPSFCDYLSQLFERLKTEIGCFISLEDDLQQKDYLKRICRSFKFEEERIKSYLNESLDLLRKIEFAFSVTYFLNAPEKVVFEKELDNDNIVVGDEMAAAFDMHLDNFGVFSYIQSVCCDLYDTFRKSGFVNFGNLWISIPVILKMTEQFYFTGEDKGPHPFLTKKFSQKMLRHIEQGKINNYFLRFIFRFAAGNKKMVGYRGMTEDDVIEVVPFFMKIISIQMEMIEQGGLPKYLPSVRYIYEKMRYLIDYLNL